MLVSPRSTKFSTKCLTMLTLEISLKRQTAKTLYCTTVQYIPAKIHCCTTVQWCTVYIRPRGKQLLRTGFRLSGMVRCTSPWARRAGAGTRKRSSSSKPKILDVLNMIWKLSLNTFCKWYCVWTLRYTRHDSEASISETLNTIKTQKKVSFFLLCLKHEKGV